MRLAHSPAPLRTAVLLVAADIALTVAGALTLEWALPAVSAWTARLIVVLVLAVGVAALIAWTRSSHATGLTAHSKHRRLLILPAVIALLPLVGGVALPDAGLLTVLIVGYAATGFFEEALFRGVIVTVLRPAGAWRAVWISSALFACAHLPNMLFGQAPAVTAAQAVGTFCFGVGYAALRLRTNGLWPLIVLHFLTDLFLQIDALPSGAHWAIMVGGDTVLLCYGALALRNVRTVAEGDAEDVILKKPHAQV